MSQQKKVSAVVACYMDAQAIPLMYERLKSVFSKINVNSEIIFVNDSSPDDSQEVLEELAKRDSNAVVIKHTRNFGSQSAFTSGMRIASGDAVVLLDGDLQDPPELIEEFYKKWQEGYDVVYGRRIKRKEGKILQVLRKLFYRLFRAVSYVSIPLDAGDFSLMDRKVVKALNQLPENNRFLRGLRAWVGFKQTGVPYVREQRMFGNSTNSWIRNIGWARKAIFSFSYFPLEVITWIAMFTVGVSVLGVIVQVVLRFSFPGLAPHGFTTLILLILFLGGVQLLCFGVIGTYLMHIYDEIKRRPPYIVESILNASSDRNGDPDK